MRFVSVCLFSFLILLGACADQKSKPIPNHSAQINKELGWITTGRPIKDSQEIKSLIKTGIQLYNSNPDSAQRILKSAIGQALQWRQYGELGMAFEVLAVAQFNMGDFVQSKTNFYRALDYYALSDSGKRRIPNVYKNLGNVFVHMECTDTAVFYYRKALALVGDATDSSKLKIAIYNGMSGCLIMADLYTQAAFYINESMKIALAANKKDDIAYCYSMMASMHEKKAPDFAIIYYKKALDYYKDVDNKVRIKTSLKFIGNMWILKKQPDSAEYYYYLSDLVLPQSYKDPVHSFMDKGNVALTRGEYAKAVEQYKKAESFLTPKIFAEDALIIYRNLSSSYKEMRNDLLAYKYQSLYYHLKDSIFNDEKLATINHLNMQFRLAEKDRDLLTKQLLITGQNEKIQKQYLGMATAIILVLALLIILYRRKHRMILVGINAKLAGAEQERLRLAQEIHDGIVSTLTSVKMNFNALPEYEEELSAKQFKETLAHLDASISELRQTTHNLHPALLQHVGLANAIASLIAQINVGGKVKFSTRISGDLPVLSAGSELHLYRIIQELIQNILKHAAATEARLDIAATDELLRVEIEDNGKGIGEDQAFQKNGIGFSNIQDRVQLLKGTLHMKDIQNGTSITLQFITRDLIAYI